WLLIEKPFMHKFKIYLLITLFTLGGTIVQAQNIDNDSAYTPATDSVGSIEDVLDDDESEQSNDESEKTHNFDPIFPIDKAAIVSRNVDDSTVNRLRNDDNFWYVNEAPKKEKPVQP